MWDLTQKITIHKASTDQKISSGQNIFLWLFLNIFLKGNYFPTELIFNFIDNITLDMDRGPQWSKFRIRIQIPEVVPTMLKKYCRGVGRWYWEFSWKVMSSISLSRYNQNVSSVEPFCISSALIRQTSFLTQFLGISTPRLTVRICRLIVSRAARLGP